MTNNYYIVVVNETPTNITYKTVLDIDDFNNIEKLYEIFPHIAKKYSCEKWEITILPGMKLKI